MINIDDYRIDEVDGKWVLSKDDYENEPVVLLKRKEKKYIFVIYRGIRSGAYKTEEELLEDIENVPPDTSFTLNKVKWLGNKSTYTTYFNGTAFTGNVYSSSSYGRTYLNWYI